MKRLLSGLLLTVCFSLAFAQEKLQNEFYFNKEGILTSNADSVYFVRVLQEPDSGSKLYPLLEYYANGQKKRVGHSADPEILFLEGQVAEYFPSGKRKSFAFYKSNLEEGITYEYYPNGQLYCSKYFFTDADYKKLKLDKSVRFKIISCNDSTGKHTATDGNGIFMIYKNDFHASEEGPVKEGLKDGEWKCFSADRKLQRKEIYARGKLVSGQGIDSLGNTYPYILSETFPEPENGPEKFARYLNSEIKRKGHLHRKETIAPSEFIVRISFHVEKDGHLTHATILNSPLVEESTQRILQCVMSAPAWKPGKLYGMPVSVLYTFPLHVTTIR